MAFHSDYLIDPDSLNELFGVVTTPDAAEYLLDTVQSLAKSQPNENLRLGGDNHSFLSDEQKKVRQEQIDEVKRFYIKVQARSDKFYHAQPWSGEETVIPVAPAAKVSREIEEVVESIAEIESVHIDFSVIGEMSTELIIQYTDEQEELFADDKVSAMNNLLEKWLNLHFMTRRGESLYKAIDQSGKPSLDSKGNLIKVNASEFEKLIQDKKEGFKNFLKTWDIKATLSEYKYQSPAKSSENAPATQPAAKGSDEPSTAPSQSLVGKQQL